MSNLLTRSKACITLVPCVAGLLLTACSLQGSPSTAMARQYFEESLANRKSWTRKGVGNYRIVSFRKSNGLASKEDGVDRYQLMYEAQLEYPEGNYPFCIDKSLRPPSGIGMKALNCLFTDANVQAVGAKQDLKGAVTFVKTEEGWRPEDIAVRCEPAHMSHQWCAQ